VDFEIFGLGLERQQSFEVLAGGEVAHSLPLREKRRGLFLGGHWYSRCRSARSRAVETCRDRAKNHQSRQSAVTFSAPLGRVENSESVTRKPAPRGSA
jgi:hypothetical protein